MRQPEPNLIDKVVGYFSPKAALNRLRNRTALALAGGYNGGSLNRVALRNYNPGVGDANSDIIQDLDTLRARSRDLTRNSPVGGGAVHTQVNNVIGTGLSFKSNPDAEYLGWTDEQAAQYKKEVEAEWQLWCSSQDCDASRSTNFYGLQSLAFRSMLESGDVIALTPAIKRQNNPYSLAVQLIEADRLSNKGRAADTDTMVAGVTMDGNGAPISYSFSKNHPGSIKGITQEWIEVPAYGENGRKNVIHLFDKRRPGQVRGVPYLAPVIEILKQVSRQTEAELQAAVISATFAMFMKMDADAFGSLFQQDTQERYIANASSWDGQVKTTLEGPGKIVNLMPGEEPVAVDLGRPNVNFDPFFLSMMTQIGCAIETPREVLLKHFSSSYSASRAALLEHWRVVRVKRDSMSTYFCEPIKELWFEEAVSLGRIQAPGFFSDQRIRQAYTRGTWIGDGAGSIDPQKEVSAARERIEIGISTREKESIAFDGGNWEDNHKQLAKEQQMRKADDLIEQPQQQFNNFPEENTPNP